MPALPWTDDADPHHWEAWGTGLWVTDDNDE